MRPAPSPFGTEVLVHTTNGGSIHHRPPYVAAEVGGSRGTGLGAAARMRAPPSRAAVPLPPSQPSDSPSDSGPTLTVGTGAFEGPSVSGEHIAEESLPASLPPPLPTATATSLVAATPTPVEDDAAVSRSARTRSRKAARLLPTGRRCKNTIAKGVRKEAPHPNTRHCQD